MNDPQLDSAALRLEIDRTRAELGETVAALAAKADVKARAREAVTDLGDQLKVGASAAVRRPTPWAVLGAVSAAGALVAWLIWRRRT